MELLLTTGQTSFVINVITDALVLVAGFGLIKSLNAYGRWKLYHKGKASIDLNFQETTILPAFMNAYRVRKSSIAVAILFCIQASVCAILMTLKAVAPIGVSQSTNFRVSRNMTVKGEALCRESDPSYALSQIGEATRRIKLHFKSGGGLLSVGRTGRNDDSLIMEDKEKSLGFPRVINDFTKSIPISITANPGGPNITLNVPSVMHEDERNVSVTEYDGMFTFQNLSYPSSGLHHMKGPLYMIYLFNQILRERYAFGICEVPVIQLQEGDTRIIRSACNISNLQRDTSKTGLIKSIEPVPQILRDLYMVNPELDISILGHRWIMLFDLAKTMGDEPCGDSYVAYRPYSHISNTSIIVICALGGFSLLGLVAASLSHWMTLGTFDWNSSYERLVNLAAHSDSIQLESCWDIGDTLNADVVVESLKGSQTSYHVQVIPKGYATNPIPHANIKLIK